MNKKTIWQVIIVVAAIAVLIFGPPALNNKNSDSQSQQTSNQPTQDSQGTADQQSQSISLTIDGLYSGKQVTISQDQTVLQVLQSINSTDQQVRLLTKTYSGLGVLVESLGGVANGTNGKYWQYKVNDIMPQVGADQYKLKAGDKIEWYFSAPESPSN